MIATDIRSLRALPRLGTICHRGCSLTLHCGSVDITENQGGGTYRKWGPRSRKVKCDNRKNDSLRCHRRRLDAGSRVLGLLRDIVLANAVGASAGADAFFVAFKIPNFLRRLFGEGAFAQAFVPVFTETREKEGDLSVKRLIDQVAGRLGLILIAISILGCPAGALDCAPFCARVLE